MNDTNIKYLTEKLEIILGCSDVDVVEFQEVLDLLAAYSDYQYNRGYDAGRKDYEQSGTDNYQKAYNEGKADGYEEGYDAGYDDSNLENN